MKKRLLLAVVLVLILGVLVGLTACRKPTTDPVKTIYDVSTGTAAVGAAIEKAVNVAGADNVYLACRLVVDNGPDTYDLVYDLSAMLDMDNDANCKMLFKAYEDISNKTLMEAYYAAGILYVNKQPVVDKAAVQSVSLSAIASTLRTSSEEGQVGFILRLLPKLGDRVFSACERAVDGNAVRYTFTLDYGMLSTFVQYFVSQTGLGTPNEVTHLLGLDRLTDGHGTTMEFVTETVDGVGEVFRSATITTSPVSMSDAEPTVVKTLSSFACVPLSDTAAAQDQYRLTMPDNLSAFVEYHPANLVLNGILNLDVTSSSTAAYLGSQPLTTSFAAAKYAYDVSLRSNVSAVDGWTASLSIVNRSDRDRAAEFFFAGDTLYVNLSALSLGRWTLPAAEIQRAAEALGRSRTSSTLAATDYRDILWDLLVDRAEEGDNVTYSLKTDNIVRLYNTLQEVLTDRSILTLPVVRMDNLQVTLNTQNNTFKGMQLTASVWGCKAVWDVTYPQIGRAVEVNRPEWCADCVDVTTATVTPVAHGIVRAFTAANSTTALLRAFLQSVSDVDVELGSDEIYYYNFAANVTGKGRITAVSVDFFTDDPNHRVCSLYYHEDTPDELYVIMPSDATTRVITLPIKETMRYVGFVRAINGNIEVRDMPECTVSNTQSSLSFTWGATGLNAMLARYAAVLAQQSLTSIPNDLGLQALRVTMGTDSALRLMFAGDRFVEFGVDEFALTDASLDLVSTASRWNDVSYFEANNLPATLLVKIGDGSAKSRAMTLSLSDFGTQWSFDYEPAMGSGRQMVTAYCTLLGQRVELPFEVDCSRPAGVEILDTTPYQTKLEGHVFGFDRYSEDVSPIAVVQSFRYVRVTVGARSRDLSLLWLHGGREIGEADFGSPDHEDGNQTDYVLQPAVTNFFGHVVTLDSYEVDGAPVTLAGTYTLRLTGAKISTVRNAATFLTLHTYGDTPYDPFDAATYDSADPEFLTANGLTVSEVNNWVWDIDSIQNKSRGDGGIRDSAGDVYPTQRLLPLMHDQLYSLNGKYGINLKVLNSLGVVEKTIGVTVAVSPYVVRSVTFQGYADGVNFRAESGDYKGCFDVVAQARDTLSNSFAFARTAVVTFENGESRSFAARDWTVTPVSAVVMFAEYRGDVVLTVGDAAGGYQDISLHYVVAARPVDGVALWGWDGDARVELAGTLQQADATTTALSFTLDALNPYDYVYPAGLAVHHGASVEYVAHTFTFAGWDVNKLWHTATPFVTTESVHNVLVTLSMQFVEKQAAEVVQFAGMQRDDEGDYVFIDGAFVHYDGTSATHRASQRYRALSDPTVLYTQSKSGAYTKVDGEYVLYDKNNPEHVGLTRYTYDFVVATPYVYTEDAEGAFVRVEGAYVAYDAVAHAGLVRYSRSTTNVVYRHGADGIDRLVMDPNKVDYLDTAAYPQLVVVRFTDGTTAVLDAVWNIAALSNVNPDENYTGNDVEVYVAMGQRLGKVYMRIESTRPRRLYYSVQLDENGDPVLDEDGYYVGGKNDVELQLLTTDEGGNLVVNDLTDEKLLHAIICGCDREGCKGYLYFDYGDSTTSNDRFAISEWQNLDAIAARIRAELAKPDAPALQELSFNVDVTAVARNIKNTITVHVKASQMTGVTYPESGMPLAPSSMNSGGTDVYSMQCVGGTALTVDPYVADVKDSANYPKQLSFLLGERACTAFVDDWDLSALNGLTPYLGAEVTVYACLQTPFGEVRVPAALTVKRRVVQSVYVDGSDNRFIYINAMDSRPFGEDVVVENGRTVAVKTVEVKFENDDRLYPMSLRYDITDYRAPYYNAELSKAGISVQVGNPAGGYQTLDNYRVYTSASNVIVVSVPDTDPAYALLKAYLQDGEANWDGVLYNDGVFVTFDNSEAANAAWRAMTTANRTLTLQCGYVDAYGVPVVRAYNANLCDESALGVGYRWERASMGNRYVMRLVVWNTVALAGDHLASTQYVSTGTDRSIRLTRGMLSIAGVEGETDAFAYDGRSVGAYLAARTVGIVGELLTEDNLSVGLYRAADTAYASPLSADDVLQVGQYVLRISVHNTDYYTGEVLVTVTVSTRQLTNVEVRIVGVPVRHDTLLAGYVFDSKAGNFLTIVATDLDTHVDVEVAYYDQGDNLLVGIPTAEGTYRVQLVSADANSRVDLGGGADSFTLQIQ